MNREQIWQLTDRLHELVSSSELDRTLRDFEERLVRVGFSGELPGWPIESTLPDRERWTLGFGRIANMEPIKGEEYMVRRAEDDLCLYLRPESGRGLDDIRQALRLELEMKMQVVALLPDLEKAIIEKASKAIVDVEHTLSELADES